MLFLGYVEMTSAGQNRINRTGILVIFEKSASFTTQ